MQHKPCFPTPKKRIALTVVAEDEGGAFVEEDEEVAAELGLTLADDVGLDPPTVPEGSLSSLT
jgi:hypothetical protein